ncbi:MAG: DUF1569 domain-containing protein [Isosphaeraceae bacterium]
MSARRTLVFESLDQVMPDVDRLLEGHETVGQWSLGQICHHLTVAMVGSMDKFPGAFPWIVRATIGPIVFRRMLSQGRMPEGVWLPKNAVPKPGLDARAEAEALRAAVRLYQGHSGPMAVHPFFGRLSREQWDGLHKLHCAHHLSFALPKAAVASA